MFLRSLLIAMPFQEAKRAAEMAAAGSEKENKKELTKAERRAIQEAQRAKKTQEKSGPAGDKPPATKDTPVLKSSSNTESPPKQEACSAEKKKDMPSKKVSFADSKLILPNNLSSPEITAMRFTIRI